MPSSKPYTAKLSQENAAWLMGKRLPGETYVNQVLTRMREAEKAKEA